MRVISVSAGKQCRDKKKSVSNDPIWFLGGMRITEDHDFPGHAGIAFFTSGLAGYIWPTPMIRCASVCSDHHGNIAEGILGHQFQLGSNSPRPPWHCRQVYILDANPYQPVEFSQASSTEQVPSSGSPGSSRNHRLQPSIYKAASFPQTNKTTIYV